LVWIDTAGRRWFLGSRSQRLSSSQVKYFGGEDCGRELESAVTGRLRRGTGDGDDGHVVYLKNQRSTRNLVNLNMCSAWTVLSLRCQPRGEKQWTRILSEYRLTTSFLFHFCSMLHNVPCAVWTFCGCRYCYCIPSIAPAMRMPLRPCRVYYHSHQHSPICYTVSMDGGEDLHAYAQSSKHLV
jgi:hypothetical protein